MEEPLLLYPENYIHEGFPSWSRFYSLRETKGNFFMKKVLIIVIIIFAAFFTLGLNDKCKEATNVQTELSANTKISYKGEIGKDALTILKQKLLVSQDNSGMINVIAGKKADTTKREYWAFYVNGKMANVGPADYKTKNTDLIEWKIEKY